MPMKRNLLTVILLAFCLKAVAQTAPPSDMVTIEQNFKKMQVLGSVLYVAAHPDDENTRLLAYLAQEKHYRTGYLSLTRGDGGQNLIGNEQGELLGLTRTQELLAARRTDGAEQFFTRANDFGFSKGPQETLKIWDKEKVLSDVVWVIRKFRPDVIICRFPTTGEGGHGHHTSSAILAQEAFSAAADPKRFPEQLKYVQVWQAKRLLWNTFSFGSVNTTSPDQFKIDVGVYNPLLGKGYGEIAAESRSNHKTQGFGSAKQRGQAFEYFKTILGDAPKTDLMDGVNTTWSRVDGGEAIGKELAGIYSKFDPEHPENLVKALVDVDLKLQDKVNDNYWRVQKLKDLNELIVACAGFWVEAYANKPTYALGDTANVTVQMLLRSNANMKSPGLFFPYFHRPLVVITNKSWNNQPNNLQDESVQSFHILFKAEETTQPYWLELPHTIGSYNVEYLDTTDVEYTAQKTLPENLPPIVGFEFFVDGKVIQIQRTIEYKYTDPARGEIYEPVVVAPPVTATPVGQLYIYNSSQPQTIQFKLKSFKNVPKGQINLNVPEGWKANPATISFENKKTDDEWTESFTVTPSANGVSGEAKASIKIDGDNNTFTRGIHVIDYQHIPKITLFPPAETKLVHLDLKLTGKHIGYIPGAGDLMVEALKQVGYDVHILSENEVMNADLSVYDAIVTGVRAYNVNNRLAFEQPRLLEYVKNGGNLVIQYNNNNGLVTSEIGPYPFKPVNQRVTDENAKVTITDPNNPVLNYPNKITQADFDGWIQERGLYFVSNIDPKYHTVFEMNDPGEAPNKGSLIETEYGKGRFVYTSLDFFRELPAGVPGAYRLFVNLLSKPASK